LNKKEGKGKNTKSKDNNTISNNLLKFPKKITNNDTKKYESFNIVSETGDSIYSPPFEELTIAEESEGQVFISMDKMEDFVNQLIQHRLGPLFNNNKNEH